MRFILAVLFTISPLANGWTLNDVSLLLPLPSVGEQDLLLSPRSQSLRGELLPYAVYEDLPRLILGTDRSEIFDWLRVVAIRIDPCFRESGGPTSCRRQIRMVWQPILVSSGGGTITADAAVHTFYDLTDDEWNSLTRELSPLAGSGTESLDIHPRIRSQGLAGEHWQRLKEIFLKYAGEKNLTRATAMSVNPLGSFWAFSGLNIENDVRNRILIPRIHLAIQTVIADIVNLSEVRLDLRPAPEQASQPWLDFISESRGTAQRSGEAYVREALREALRLENPLLENPGSVDCVSCHVAQTVRVWGERNLPKWRWNTEDEAFKNTYGYDLKNNSVQPGNSNRLRAFGYFNDEAVISQRLIHESAQVLTSIQNQFKSECADFLERKNQ